MQADEEYGNQIWDKYFGKNYHILEKQKNYFRYQVLLILFHHCKV